MSSGGSSLLRLPPAPAVDDEALVAACARGDRQALGALFDRHDASVRRFLSRACGIPLVDLDDLVHATFLEVYRAARAFRASASTKTWIFGIAVNLARHHVRGEARRRRFLTALAGLRRNSLSFPQARLEQREALERMDAALSALPYERRAAFMLCELEGLTAAEAGSVLGVRPGSIGRWLHETRKALRATIGWAPT